MGLLNQCHFSNDKAKKSIGRVGKTIIPLLSKAFNISMPKNIFMGQINYTTEWKMHWTGAWRTLALLYVM